jgi:hypothetical protein
MVRLDMRDIDDRRKLSVSYNYATYDCAKPATSHGTGMSSLDRATRNHPETVNQTRFELLR